MATDERVVDQDVLIVGGAQASGPWQPSSR